MFVELPSEVVTSVLTSWIKLRDLSRLDAACCHRASRTVFLTLLHQTDYHNSPVTQLSEEAIVSYMRWAADRRVLSKCEKLSYHSKRLSGSGSASGLSDTLLEVEKCLFSDQVSHIHSASMVLLELNSTRNFSSFFTPTIVARLVELLRHKNAHIVMYTLGIVGNRLLEGVDAINQLLELELLPTLQTLLVHPATTVAQHVYGVIANIMLGTHEHIQTVIDTGLLPQFITRLQCKDSDFRQDAIHALRNVVDKGNQAQKMLVAQLGAAPALCVLIGSLSSSNTITVLTLLDRLFLRLRGTPLQDTIKDEVRDCGGVAKLQQLRASRNVGSFRAESFLQSHFPEEMSHHNTAAGDGWHNAPQEVHVPLLVVVTAHDGAGGGDSDVDVFSSADEADTSDEEDAEEGEPEPDAAQGEVEVQGGPVVTVGSEGLEAAVEVGSPEVE